MPSTTLRHPSPTTLLFMTFFLMGLFHPMEILRAQCIPTCLMNMPNHSGQPDQEQIILQCFTTAPCAESCPGAVPCVQYKLQNLYQCEVVGVKFNCTNHHPGDNFIVCDASDVTTSVSWNITPSGCSQADGTGKEEVYIKAPGYPGYPPSPVPSPGSVTGLGYQDWLNFTICGGCPKCGIEIDFMDPTTGVITPCVFGDSEQLPGVGDCCNP